MPKLVWTLNAVAFTSKEGVFCCISGPISDLAESSKGGEVKISDRSFSVQ